ncbi:cystatin-like fold lipoprotein [Staphylococcus aureus]|nr:cystatin-like fold lipoprotein [Staphylococcus aureus]
MKRFVATVLLLLVFISRCGNDKYVKEIDEAVKIQNQKQEQLAKKATVIVLIILNAKMLIFMSMIRIKLSF